MLKPADLIGQIPPEIISQLTLALDADKTITRLDRSISPATQAAIQAVVKNGGRVGLCTGRGYAVATPVLKVFPADSVHVVGGGGAMVTTGGHKLWGRELSGEILAKILAQAEKVGCGYGFGLGDKFYVSQNRKEALEAFLSPLKFSDPAEIEDLEHSPTPLLVITELNPAMRAFLAQFDDQITLKEMLDYKNEAYVDITAKGVTKATGLNQLASYYGIPVEQIITVGDGLNDFEMIQAGYGVAMGNSGPELKKMAKLIISHTDDDGLAEFIFALIEAKKILAGK